MKIAPPGFRDRRGERAGAKAFAALMAASLVFHGVALGGLAIWKGRPTRQLDLSRAIPVQLVKLGKARDPKLLPRITSPAPPPQDQGKSLDLGKTPDPAKKSDPKRPTDKPPDKLSNTAERLLAGAELDRAFSQIDEPEGDPEGDPMGTTTDRANAAAGYYKDVVKALQANYSMPEVITPSERRFLNARVVLWIERNGRISEYRFLERHPNTMFMGRLEAMLKSIRLPPPPPGLADQVENDGVEVIFRP